MRHTGSCFILALGFLVSVAGGTSAQMDQELVQNGGGETGDLTGWIGGGIEALPTPDALAAGFGDFVFWGSTGETIQTLRQVIDVSAESALIDGGELFCRFQVQLQARGLDDALDTAEAAVSFHDSTGSTLSSYVLQDVDPLEMDWDVYADVRLVPIGTVTIEVLLITERNIGISNDGFMDEVSLRLTMSPEAFRRGDANTDTAFDISDVIFSLEFLFSGTSFLTCEKAADSNDDGQIDVSDTVYSLHALFSGGPPLPAPGSAVCGEDPTADSLTCDESGCL